MKQLLIIGVVLLGFNSCKKDECQTCTKTIGGFAGNIVDEQREVCSKSEAERLEASSAGTTVWTCN